MGQIITAGTGHRPNRLTIGGRTAYHPQVYLRLVQLCGAYLRRHRPDRGISGMAQGFDMALAEAFVRLGIPWTAAVPCDGQEALWKRDGQRKYRELLKQADEVVIVTPGPYSGPEVMEARNRWMVDRASRLVALSNGDIRGGTANCIRYAESRQREIYNLWPHWEKYAIAV